MPKVRCILSLTICCLVLVISTRAQTVLINEIMYHPSGTNLLDEWVELYNAGTNAADLSGWKFSKGVGFTFATNTTLAAGDYLVVASSRTAFTNKYPTVTNFVAGWVGALSQDGEEIRLDDALGHTVSSVSYAAEGDWAVRRIGALDAFSRQGWEWFAEHDGLGKSLELINRDLPNDRGQNWASSTVANGTPGRINSTLRTNIAPLILEVAHTPVVPKSSDPVTITTRILDERTNGLTVTLNWRVDGAASFAPAAMFDDGAHGDGIANDGIFGVILGVQGNGIIIEFYVTARDLENNSRTYPNVIPSGGSRTANLAYQVDNSVYSGNQPVFRLILTQAENDYLSNQIWTGAPDSDALVSGTFVNTDGVLDGGTTSQVRYNCGFRNRGHGTRTAVPHNFHVAFPKDRPWKGRNGLSLNTHYTHSQQLGSAVFRRLELPMADSRPVQVRVNAVNLAKAGQEQFGSYVANELVDDKLVKDQFPLDPEGNLYRGVRDLVPGMSADADLVWHGALYTSYTNAYLKENNKSLNNWSDLLHLIDVLNNTPDVSYASAVSNVANVDEWMKYFAVNTLFDNQENSLGIGAGDDYALYRGTNDARFQLLPYDMDSMMGRGTTASTFADGLWRMTNVAAINRFMKRPEFVPLYFKHLKNLAETTFSPARMNPLLDQLLTSYVDAPTLVNMKAFNASHVAYVLSQFPQTLTVGHNLAVVSGYPRTATATIALHGTGNAVDTRSIRVNGITAAWTAWEGVWTNNSVTLRPGINRVLVEALGVGGVEVGRTTIDLWYDDATVAAASGAIAANTIWTPAGGPYQVTANLTINSGVTLTIQPGTTVYLDSGVNLTVANGGRLLAEGTASAPIRFTRLPGGAANWGGITVNGGAGTPETRIAYAHFEFNGSTAIHSAAGTLFLDHLTFGNTAVQYVSLDSSSFVVQDCLFPTPTAGFEPVHGTQGIKAGGRGIVRRNYWGRLTGYNDAFDFTGGNRPGPILQVLNNVFAGSDDDLLDLDSTDAWVEGNLFLHCHRNGASPDSSSAVSGGSDNTDNSQITIIGNIMYDCDHAANAKQTNFYTLINNTIVHQSRVGSIDPVAAVVILADDTTSQGAGMYLEGNIIYDAENLTRNVTTALVTFTNNIIHQLQGAPWTGLGGNNSTNNPLLNYVPQLSETTNFNSWAEAQVMWDWLSLRTGSPARGTGPNGRDKGGVSPTTPLGGARAGVRGVSIGGEPVGVTQLNSATLRVGVNRTGSGIPAAGFPNGSGFTHYKWRLDGGAWSAETPIATPITLNGLANGSHYVEASGRSDAGFYQDDAVFGVDAIVTASRTWTVNTSYVPPTTPTVRINEVLAKNLNTLTNLGTTPDLIELYNFGANTVDLSGLGLSDNSVSPYKFVFPPTTLLASGAFLVLYADNATGGPYLHTGFSLKPSGDDLYLTDTPAGGGAFIDSIVFGIQIADFSIGRRTDGTWGLCKPTFGTANIAQLTGNERALKINEWLADAQFVANNDFLELYNPDPLPVALGGLYLSDAAGAPTRHTIAPLSFIAGKGLTEFIADSDPGQGADHLTFKLSPDVGLILLSAPDLTLIDCVNYSSQRTDVSEGRSPDGSDAITTLAQPTPGGGNPGTRAGDCTLATTTIPLLPMASTWRFNQTSNFDGVSWYTSNYNDSAWASGPALLAEEDCNCLPAPGINTTLTLGRTTYYFRAKFEVNTNLAGFNLNLTTVVDDGAIVYLNGTRILTNGMSTGTPSYATFASRAPLNASAEFFTVSSAALVQGTNVVAVEVHQSSANSTDITFGMSLDASRTVTNCDPGSVVAVVLNEVLADNHTLTNFNGATADFVELYNPGTNLVDLTEMSLTDDSSFARKWVFPAGASLAPGAYRVIYFDGGQTVSSTNTGFGLKASGGVVFFFNRPASGGGLIDAIRFGLQTPDFSIARLPNGTGNWNLAVPTRGAFNVAAGLSSVSALRINEWMADPRGGNDWFEVYNSGAQPVALGALFLTDDLEDKTQSPVQPLSFIGVGANAYVQFIADGNTEAGADHVTFSLSKSGEALGLFSPVGVMLNGLGFNGQTTGVSQGRFPDGSANIVSFATTPSPAESNYLPLTNAVVNEVLTHSDPPLEDAVELFNPSAFSTNIGGWYLSNSKQNFKKFRIPDGTMLEGNNYRVFYETQLNTGATAFTFNGAHGDSAILSQADAGGNLTGYRSEVRFGAAANGVSFGRYQTSVGVDFTAMSAHTFGADNPGNVGEFRTGAGLLNSAPKVGPLVVSEILYISLTNGMENPDEEFIEIQNITGSPVPLFDPASPTNTWQLRDAVDFEFPMNVTLAAGSRLLIVGFNPDDLTLLAAFRFRFNVPAAVAVFGPWSGRLDNGSDSVELVKPDPVQLPPHPDAGFVPRVLVDRVYYSSFAPWPAAGSNGSNSLQRLTLGDYGNDPVNWQSAAPTPGQANGGGGGDTDGDGMADSWEINNFGTLSRNGSGDFDGDGATDLEEYLAGTNPTNPGDYLKIVSSSLNGNTFTLTFIAVAGKTYSVLYRDLADSGAWTKLSDVTAQLTTGPVQVSDNLSNVTRFFLLVTPKKP